MFSLVAFLSSIWTSLQHQAHAQGSILGSQSQNVYLEDDIALLELLAPVAHAAASAGRTLLGTNFRAQRFQS